jgi:hypothetical protein
MNFTNLPLENQFEVIRRTKVGGFCLKYPDGAFFNFLNTELLKDFPSYSSLNLTNYHKMYFVDEITQSNSGGNLYGRSNGIPSKEVIVCSHGLNDSTAVHELFHALGLYHSFSNSSKYVFEKNKTDNIMDYSDINGIPVIATWQFQWKILNKNL